MATERLITVSGSFADGALGVETLQGHEALGDPFSFTLGLVSQAPDIDLSSLVGDTMTVSVTLDDEVDPRYLNGYVTRMELLDTFDRFAHYQATLRPWFWLLSSRINSRIFQHKSVPDIAKALFREHGFADFQDSLSGSYPSLEFVVQYRESDFSFVSRLFEKAGIYYFFKHEKGRHVLVLADSPDAHKPAPGYAQLPFHPEGSPTPDAGEFLNRWRVAHQWRPGTYTSDDYDFERPKAQLTATAKVTARHKKGDLEVFEYPSGHIVSSEGETYSRTRLEALQSDVEIVRAEGDVRGPGAGQTFTLTDHPLETQNKHYLIVSAAYDARNDPFDTDAAGGEASYHAAYTVIDSKVHYRPLLSTPAPRVEGVQTATVVGQAGEEIWTDKYGRVRVQFHWDREGKNNEQSSCWVRVAQVWAGSGWGAMHIPRIGQEVIVDFLEGDPDRPIIVGRVYNGNNMPPYTLPDNRTQSGIKSRSTPGGGPSNYNEIRFEDKKGQEEFHVQAEKDHTSLVKNNQSIDVGAARSLTVGTDETVKIGKSRTETVGTDETVTITSNQSLTVGASRTKTVTANETITIGAASSETVGATRTVTIAAAYQIAVGGVLNETVAGASAEVVGADKSVTVAGAHSVNVGGSSSEKVGGDKSISAGGNVSVEAGGALSASAGKAATIEAADSITLKCGDATITLKKNGDISINGKNITVNASGDLTQKGSKIAQN
jgi:type VI secretion system secreted protein VgrG